jgi:hypothetical protein
MAKTKDIIKAAELLDAAQWTDLRARIDSAVEQVLIVSAEGDRGYRATQKPGGLVGVELTGGPSGTALVEARSGNQLPGMPHGSSPALFVDIPRAAEIARARADAESLPVVLLNQSYLLMLTRFAASTGIDESPEGEAKLVERVNQILTDAGLYGVAVAIQSRYQRPTNPYTFQGSGTGDDIEREHTLAALADQLAERNEEFEQAEAARPPVPEEVA